MDRAVPPSTPVRSFQFTDRSSSPILSYPVGTLLDHVHDQYGNAAGRFPDDLPSHDDMADPEIGLRIPSITSLARGRSRDELLDEAADLLGDRQPLPYSSPANEVIQALLFQRPRMRTATPQLPPEIEFHDIVAALGQFPMLLRRVGLVIDFVVPTTTFFPDGGPISPGRVWAGPTPWKTSTPTRRVFPYTWWESPFQPKPRSATSDLVDGYLRLGDSRFQAVQVDLDGAVAQLATMADNLAAHVGDPAHNAAPGTGLPALRSSGIGIARSERATQLGKTLGRAKQLDDQIPDSATTPMELYAEDLVRGYRPLILRVGDGQVALPCMRHEWHHLLDADPDHRRVDDDAHAWISTGPTESDHTPPELYLQEVVVRWEGWALSVPRPGKWIAPDGCTRRPPTSVPDPTPTSGWSRR